MKRQISERAIYYRVKRALRRSGEFLITTRRKDSSLCRYYVVDYNNHITGGTDGLVELARDLKVMASYEEMVLS